MPRVKPPGARRCQRAAALLATAALAATGAAVLAAAGPAQASSEFGCYQSYTQNATCTMPNYHYLIAVWMFDQAGTHRVCSSAIDLNGTNVTGWSCATGNSELCLSGNSWLDGYVGSGDTSTFTGYAYDYWSQGCP